MIMVFIYSEKLVYNWEHKACFVLVELYANVYDYSHVTRALTSVIYYQMTYKFSGTQWHMCIINQRRGFKSYLHINSKIKHLQRNVFSADQSLVEGVYLFIKLTTDNMWCTDLSKIFITFLILLIICSNKTIFYCNVCIQWLQFSYAHIVCHNERHPAKFSCEWRRHILFQNDAIRWLCFRNKRHKCIEGVAGICGDLCR